MPFDTFDKSFDSEGQVLRTFGGERSVEPLRLEELSASFAQDTNSLA